MPDNLPLRPISVACSNRLSNGQPLTGAYTSAMTGRLHLCLADLFMCLAQMTEAEALRFAVDDLLPLTETMATLQDLALKRGGL